MCYLILALSSTAILCSSAYASEESPYDSGYDRGCDDARISDPDDRYINKDGKGADNHTNEFMDGYNDGYDSCGGGNLDRGSDDNENNNENNNENENSQSQSQNQGIYICHVNGCVPQ